MSTDIDMAIRDALDRCAANTPELGAFPGLTDPQLPVDETSTTHPGDEPDRAGAMIPRPQKPGHQRIRQLGLVAAAIAVIGAGVVVLTVLAPRQQQVNAPTAPSTVTAPEPAATEPSTPTTAAATTVADPIPATTDLPDLNTTSAVNPADVGTEQWLLPSWLPDGYTLAAAWDGAGGGKTVRYINGAGDNIYLSVSVSAGLPDVDWTRVQDGTGFDATARNSSIDARISADRIDAAGFQQLLDGARAGTAAELPGVASMPTGFADDDVVATYVQGDITHQLHADGATGYYCIKWPGGGVCPYTLLPGRMMTDNGGGAGGGVVGSTTTTAMAMGIVDPAVARIEVEFVDGQRISVQPTDLTGLYGNRFWLVVTTVELDAPLEMGASPGGNVRVVTAFDSEGNILATDDATPGN